MSRQIFIGLIAEGPTDYRFLRGVLERAFTEIAFECESDIEIYVEELRSSKKGGMSFTEQVVAASHDGLAGFGMMTLAVHSDADNCTYDERLRNKFVPAREALDALDDSYCKLITPVIPVRMIESWMLADKELLKDELGTTLSDEALGLGRDPEKISNPKAVISEAIRKAGVKPSVMTISDLYDTIGARIGSEALMRLDSYRRFLDEIRATYRAIGYLR